MNGNRRVGWEAGSGDSSEAEQEWLVGESSKMGTGVEERTGQRPSWDTGAVTAPSGTSHGPQRIRFFLWKRDW